MYNAILVPLDGSKRAETILPHVEALARNGTARVIFMQVLQPQDFPVDPYREIYKQAYNDQKAEAEQYFIKLAENFRKKNIETTVRIASGPVVETIIATAAAEKADIVAMASHGWSGLSRVFYGSTSAGVLQKIDRPLLLIRSRRFEYE